MPKRRRKRQSKPQKARVERREDQPEVRRSVLPEPLPSRLVSAGRHAFRLEFKTPAGKMNYAGMIFMLIVVVALTGTDALQVALVAFRPEKPLPEPSALELAGLFGIILLFCTAMVLADDAIRRRADWRRKQSA